MIRTHKDFAELLSRMLHAEDIDSCVTEILEEVRESTDSDRVYIFEYDLEHACQNCTFEVVSSPEFVEIDFLQAVPLEATPWWHKQLLQDKAILVEKLEDLLPEAHSEYEILKVQNVKSIYVEPLIVNGQVWGYIGMDYVRCYHHLDEMELEWLSSLAGAISLSVRFAQIQKEERRERQQLVIAKQQAEEANRLKSAFLANMSHEIRTPLNSILSFSELLVETEAEEDRRTYYAVIKRNSDSLLNIIGDVLDLAKIDAGTLSYKIQKVDINQLCDDVVEELQYKVPGKVELSSTPDKNIAIIETDPLRLKQVISNLINNAIKFTTTGFIKLSYRQESSETIRFEVADSGAGIAKEVLPQIFNRFFQSNSFVNGCGLGLPICKSIVTHFGGQIGVESEVGKGTTFWFTLPVKSPGN